MSKLTKIKNFVRDNKDELLVGSIIGCTAVAGFILGREAGIHTGADRAAKITGALVNTYDSVNGTNLGKDLVKNAIDNQEMFMNFWRKA